MSAFVEPHEFSLRSEAHSTVQKLRFGDRQCRRGYEPQSIEAFAVVKPQTVEETRLRRAAEPHSVLRIVFVHLRGNHVVNELWDAIEFLNREPNDALRSKVGTLRARTHFGRASLHPIKRNN